MKKVINNIKVTKPKKTKGVKTSKRNKTKRK